jgi:hypothetical protein
MPKVIDMTPSWGALVRGMLAAHAEISRNDYGQVKEGADLQKEFDKMAEAADRWNEHCKSLREEEEEDTYHWPEPSETSTAAF